MPKNPNEPISTDDPLSAVRYQPATGITVNLTGSTAPKDGEIRTVVTTLTTGSLDLRYAPRTPKISDNNATW
jgi:hypothetical protein